MGNMLNTYFKSVFTKENTNYVPTASKEAKGGRVLMMEEIGITSDKIVRAINSLRNNKAAGIDEINTTMLKRTCKSIEEPLTLIYKDSLPLGVIPIDWKLANVTPISKKGSKKEVVNYRPVSLMCHGSKIIEKIIKSE